MSGAVGVTMATLGAGQAIIPGVVGILAAGVAVARWQHRTPVAVRRATSGRQVSLEQQAA